MQNASITKCGALSMCTDCTCFSLSVLTSRSIRVHFAHYTASMSKTAKTTKQQERQPAGRTCTSGLLAFLSRDEIALQSRRTRSSGFVARLEHFYHISVHQPLRRIRSRHFFPTRPGKAADRTCVKYEHPCQDLVRGRPHLPHLPH